MSKSRASQKKGFIILRHAILTEITERECEQVLEKDFKNPGQSLYFEHIKIRPVSDHISHANMNEIHWQEAAAIQESIIEEKFKPLLKRFPDYEVVYFGAAPIPLALHLGYLVEDWKRILVYLRHHKNAKNKIWYKDITTKKSKKLEIINSGIPRDKFDIDDDVIFNVEISFAIDKLEIKKSILSPVVKTVSISLKELQLDIDSTKKVNEIADSFEEALKAIIDFLPGTNTIHLVTTVPVGLAFLLGRKIRNNVVAPVQTYQYDKNEELPYNPVLMINQSYTGFTPLTDKEKKKVKKLRKNFQKNSWQNLQNLIKNEETQQQRNPTDNWFDFVLGKDTSKENLGISFWKQLDCLHKTALANRIFSLEEVTDGYHYDDSQKTWSISNRMIHSLGLKLTSSEDIEKALRLILIHEGLHYFQHNLSLATVDEIGGFPKIIEDADYQADVYAILYEYSYSRMFNSTDIDEANVSKFFTKTLEIVIAALWSFNDAGTKIKEIQVRRLNRFLIWYWQLHAVSDSRIKTIEDITDILGTKPVIEVKGLLKRSEGERVVYQLERYVDSNLEVGIFYKNRIIRSGNTGFLRLPKLIKGFIDRDHQTIKRLLEGFYRGVAN